MGVAIHFEGRLRDERSYEQLLLIVRKIASSEAWLTEDIEPAEKKLLRIRDEEDWDYEGPVKGVILYPHEDCDPVRLEFDRDLYMQEFTKTQFAGARYHVKVIALLRTIEPLFVELKVEDEGEYWETGNLQALSGHIETCGEMIQEELRKHPGAKFKVKDPDGKIIDLIA